MLKRDENGYLDPVEEIDGKWYFWAETWADAYGPYENAASATKALEEYCNTILHSTDVSIEP